MIKSISKTWFLPAENFHFESKMWKRPQPYLFFWAMGFPEDRKQGRAAMDKSVRSCTSDAPCQTRLPEALLRSTQRCCTSPKHSRTPLLVLPGRPMWLGELLPGLNSHSNPLSWPLPILLTFKLGAALDSGKFHSYTCSCQPLLKTSQQSVAPLSSDQRSHQCKIQYLVLSLTSTALSSHSLPEECNPLYGTPAESSFHLQIYLLFPPQCMDLPSKSNPQI